MASKKVSKQTNKSPSGGPSKHKKQTSKVECPVCEEIIDDSNHDSIQYEGDCGKWQHRKCAGLSKTAFENVRTSPTALCCPGCHLLSNEAEIKHLKESLANLQGKMDSIVERLNSLNDACSDQPASRPQSNQKVRSYAQVATLITQRNSTSLWIR